MDKEENQRIWEAIMALNQSVIALTKAQELTTNSINMMRKDLYEKKKPSILNWLLGRI